MRPVRTVPAGIVLALVAALGAPVQAAEEPTVQELDRRMRRMENILDSGQIADLIQRIGELEQQVRELRGRIQEQSHRIDELRQRQRNLYADLDRRIRELEVARTAAEQAAASGGSGSDSGGSGAANAGADGAGNGDGGSADAAGGGGGGEAARKAYEEAFGLLKDGRYKEAATAFGEFVEQYPKGPYADNAQYWLAESRYVTREFEVALEAFRKVISEYPDSAKVPDARLKIGYTLYELDRLDEARAALQKVIEEHKDSAVARLAEERLLKIKRETE